MENTLIQVIYRNSHEGLVDDLTLNELIAAHKILRFYRPSQKKWIDVAIDPVRQNESQHSGPERRASATDDEAEGETNPVGLLAKLRRKKKPASRKAMTAEEWFEKGFVSLHTDDDDAGALRAFTRAIALDPSNQRAYFHRGLAYEKVGNLHQAIDDFCTAIKLAPGDAKVYYLRGLARLRLGLDDEAREDLEQAVRLGYRPAIDFLKAKGINI